MSSTVQGKEIVWVMIETQEEFKEHFIGDVVMDIHVEAGPVGRRIRRKHPKGKSEIGVRRYFDSNEVLELSGHVIFKFISGKYIMIESLSWDDEDYVDADLECPGCEEEHSHEVEYPVEGIKMFAYLAVPSEEE